MSASDHCPCGVDHICKECVTSSDLSGTYIVGTEEFMRMAKDAGLLALCTRCGERDSYYNVSR